MLEWDILNYLKKWRTNLRATLCIGFLKSLLYMSFVQLDNYHLVLK